MIATDNLKEIMSKAIKASGFRGQAY